MCSEEESLVLNWQRVGGKQRPPVESWLESVKMLYGLK